MPIVDHAQRFPLAFLPTPLHPMASVSASLRHPTSDIQLWIKRDDQTGLAGGGNKTRKLELLVADALAQGADTLITTGAMQSNHCRQTAAAAAKAGLHLSARPGRSAAPNSQRQSAAGQAAGS